MIKRIRKPLSRRWWWTTLIVIAGVAVLIQLGFWQLDRLEQRRAFNMTVADRWNQPPYDLNDNQLPADLSILEYRRVEIEGDWDYENQIVLTGQTRDNSPGSILVTPLVMDDNKAVLVARGWIPEVQPDPATWDEYNEPADTPIIGLIQESQLLPNGAVPSVPDTPQREWFRINIDAIQPQMSYDLLPVFLLQLPEPDRPYGTLPFRTEPLRLDEGNHFSYAIQWFMFALILGVGYFFFIEHQEKREQRLAQGHSDAAPPMEDWQPDAENDPAAQSPDGVASPQETPVAPDLGRSAHRDHT